jgi:histidine ammonia-lyase
MGMNSVLKSRRVLKNARYVVGIELICASQAIRFHRPMRSGKGVELALECIGKKVRPIEEDRPLSDEVEAVYRMVRDGDLLAHLAKGGMRLR